MPLLKAKSLCSLYFLRFPPSPFFFSGDIPGVLCSLCDFCDPTGYTHRLTNGVCDSCYQRDICVGNCNLPQTPPTANSKTNSRNSQNSQNSQNSTSSGRAGMYYDQAGRLISSSACLQADGQGFCQTCNHGLYTSPPNSNAGSSTYFDSPLLARLGLGVVFTGNDTVAPAVATDEVANPEKVGAGTETASASARAEARIEIGTGTGTRTGTGIGTGIGGVVYTAKRGLLVYNRTRQQMEGAEVCITPDGGVHVRISATNSTTNSTTDPTTNSST